MSRLVLVRHAQASIGHANYDQLSPRGEEQARSLGAHWAEMRTVFDQVFVGPRQRHQLDEQDPRKDGDVDRKVEQTRLAQRLDQTRRNTGLVHNSGAKPLAQWRYHDEPRGKN